MKIAVIGTGYVGLVTGACLADFGLDVLCMDIDEKKISALKNGKIPIYEPELDDVVIRNLTNQRLSFTTDMKEAVASSSVIFIAVGTPPKDDGSADLQYVLAVASEIGRHLDKYTVVVNKSTVPVGTGKLVKQTIASELCKRGVSHEFDVVSNPEFLREGHAVYDFMHPDRIVIGTESKHAEEVMRQVYRVLYLNQTPFVFTTIETAEMIKYASNAFLATKISFINEMALLAEKVGANVQDIAKAMGMDGRISPKFLHAGPGYGGSCFPKDTRAIYDIGRKNGVELLIVKATIEANEKQKRKMVEKILSAMGTVKGKTIAVLGLSFKPETDDMRESPSLTIIPELIRNGATIRAYCPQGMREARWRLADYAASMTYCEDTYDAARGANALVILTEWNQFRGMDLPRLRNLMKDRFFFDLRNVYSHDQQIRTIFDYYGVGLPR